MKDSSPLKYQELWSFNFKLYCIGVHLSTAFHITVCLKKISFPIHVFCLLWTIIYPVYNPKTMIMQSFLHHREKQLWNKGFLFATFNFCKNTKHDYLFLSKVKDELLYVRGKLHLRVLVCLEFAITGSLQTGDFCGKAVLVPSSSPFNYLSTVFLYPFISQWHLTAEIGASPLGFTLLRLSFLVLQILPKRASRTCVTSSENSKIRQLCEFSSSWVF